MFYLESGASRVHEMITSGGTMNPLLMILLMVAVMLSIFSGGAGHVVILLEDRWSGRTNEWPTNGRIHDWMGPRIDG